MNLRVVLPAAVIVGVVAFLLVDTMSSTEALTYFHPVDEVMAAPADFVGERIRIGGHVVAGSIAQRPGTLDYAFEVQPVEGMAKHEEFLDQSIPVRFTGIVPDTFEDDAEVVVTGQLREDGVFVAQELVAKCPSKYEASEKNQGTY